MATAQALSRVRSAPRARQQPPAEDSRYDKRLGEILEHATDVFYEKGFDGASMRDLSRASGMSLAGLYYYFDTKEKLLYWIQKRAFETIMQQLETRLKSERDPEQRVRIFILNHLEYFLANQKAMKVLSHESDVLKNGFGSEVRGLRRRYYRICLALLEDLKRAQGLEFSPRIAVLSLFGMMNWIYTWHNPRIDADAEHTAREMGDIVLCGLVRKRPAAKGQKSKSKI
jgi:TetR/AcrR family transcriptional regulator, cholesterol catabolism regulator